MTFRFFGITVSFLTRILGNSFFGSVLPPDFPCLCFIIHHWKHFERTPPSSSQQSPAQQVQVSQAHPHVHLDGISSSSRSSLGKTLMSASLAAVISTVCTAPESTSASTFTFMSNYCFLYRVPVD